MLMITLVLLAIISTFCADAESRLPHQPYGLSETGRKEILEKHNNMRRLYASGYKSKFGAEVANMRKMEYDVLTMEFDAMTYAQTMPLEIDDRKANQGYTLHHVDGHFLNDSQIIQADYNFRMSQAKTANLNARQLSIASFKSSRNYVQMIWADARKFGCASAFFADSKVGYRTIFVCKYDQPARIAKPIFEVGKTCSKCRDPTTACDAHLCTVPSKN